ncbi:outer membrane beta-barrel protein [Microbulbifer marinus]|uniref:Putative beta-barrel porin 2 n=1 Tax=Microbulbifer marinus TaxID=658218 RepID=A0A1H4ADX8_9GAMM|nr:outer membrane beta-barrel protein [Microbulbifer marinus]SEA33921.1 Putative beta-barrel porin 2 [Microbulbifer marinus]
MTKVRLSAAIGMIVSMGAGSALAQNQAASVELGNGIEFTPTVDFLMQSDDNVLYANDEQIDSLVAVLNPSFQLSAENGVSAYKLTYSLRKGEYFDSDEDNYLDHELDGEAKWELNSRNRVTLAGSYLDGHESRGTGYSQGFGILLDEPTGFKDKDVHGIYSFGTDGAKGRIDVTAGTSERDYDGGSITLDRDRDSDYAKLGFFYNAGGKTELLTEIVRRDVDYAFTPAGAESRNSTETDVLVGITWEGTAKTTGTIKVGSRQKKFESAAREDFTGPRWEVGIRWMPRSYSAFDLITERRSDEAYGVGDFIDVQRYTLAWTHAWMDRLTSEVSFNRSNNDYEGLDRVEEVTTSSLSFNYQMQRWLSLRAGVNVSEQDSSGVDARFEYDKNLTFVGFQATL